MPVAEFTLVPELVLTVIAAALVAVGLVASADEIPPVQENRWRAHLQHHPNHVASVASEV